MQLDRARFLVSPRGRAAVSALPPELASLPLTALASRLRREFAPEEAAALAEQVTLRAAAREKLGDASPWLLAREGLEMMTAPPVAAFRARELAPLDLTLIDLTCGLGGDTAAAVAAGLRTVGMDRDAATAILAATNVPGARVVRGEAARAPFDPTGAAVLVDPSRRGVRGREFDPAAFDPPWNVAVGLVRSARAGVIKAPPGVGHEYLPPEAEITLIQLGRTLRECMVRIGAGVKPGRRRAVLLPGGYALTSEEPEAPGGTRPPGTFLFDPESCVTRAGLVRHFSARIGAWMLDSNIAYLSSDTAAFDPLCATFALLETMPFGLDRLKKRLRELRASPREIRRRAFPIEPDDLRRQLGPIPGNPVTLLCTTIDGQRTVFIARRVEPAAGRESS